MKHLNIYENFEKKWWEEGNSFEKENSIIKKDLIGSKNQYTYEEFFDLADHGILNRLHYEYMRYGGEDMSIEDYYYGNIKYWMSQL